RADITKHDHPRIVFAPNSKTLACKADDSFHLRDARTGKVLRQFEGKLANAHYLAFSPDGKTLAVKDWSAIRFWDVATGKERSWPEGHFGEITSLEFTADGKTLISASEDGTLRLWDTATSKPVPRPRLPYGGGQLAVSADGKV